MRKQAKESDLPLVTQLVIAKPRPQAWPNRLQNLFVYNFIFLVTHCSMCNFPHQGLNPCPHQWKGKVLITGPVSPRLQSLEL